MGEAKPFTVPKGYVPPKHICPICFTGFQDGRDARRHIENSTCWVKHVARMMDHGSQLTRSAKEKSERAELARLQAKYGATTPERN